MQVYFAGFERARITKGRIGRVEFQYNPELFSDNIGVEWSTVKGAGASYPIPVYSGGQLRTIDFTIYIDGVEKPGYVRKVVNELHTYIPQAKTGGKYQFQSPKSLIFAFGWFVKECLLQSMQIEYNMFTPDLQPLRATIQLTLIIIQ